MVVRGRGTPAGRDETPHSTGSLLAPPSRPERTRHPGTVVAFRIPYDVWARGGRSGGADRTAGGSGGPNARTRADCAGLHGRLNQTRKLRIGFGIEIELLEFGPNSKFNFKSGDDRTVITGSRDRRSPASALHVDTAKAVEHTEQFSINLTKPAVPPARGPRSISSAASRTIALDPGTQTHHTPQTWIRLAVTTPSSRWAPLNLVTTALLRRCCYQLRSRAGPRYTPTGNGQRPAPASHALSRPRHVGFGPSATEQRFSTKRRRSQWPRCCPTRPRADASPLHPSCS